MKYLLPPWNHQHKVIDHVDDNDVDVYALFHDMGTGKTKTAIEILRLKCLLANAYLKVLIICPLVVLENWKREILTHSTIPAAKIQIVDGCTKPNGKKLKNATKKLRLDQLSNPDASIFIINTDNVSNVALWEEILKLGIEFLIVDESHRFKAFGGKRTKALHKLSQQPTCHHKFILTGSPILQNALDLWSQFYILDPQILGANYYSFRAKYFYDANAHMPSHVHFPKWVPKDDKYFAKFGYSPEQSMDGLNTVIYQHANRVMKDEVLDLPDRVYQTLEVSMSKEQQRLYEDMRDHLVAFLDDDAVMEVIQPADVGIAHIPEHMKADLAIVKTIRLQQLICGIFTNSKGDVKEIPNNRRAILRDTLEELASNKENKIIIWTVFTPTYKTIEDICEELNINYTMLTGLQSQSIKQINVDLFNNDPSVQVIIANQGAGGTGVNLTAANYEIYYSRSFNLEHDLQADARAYRGGQKRKTTRIDLVTPDTIDSRIVERLAEKRKHAEDILAVKNDLSRSDILGMI